MSRLFDRQSNQWVDVNDDDVTDLVSQGSHAFESNIDIPVVAPDGRLGSIKSDRAEEAFREGYRWATHQDALANEDRENEKNLQARYGKDQLVNAGTAGVLRGFTFGLSDPAMTAAASLVGKGEEVKEGLKQLKERNPVVSTIGQTAGALANPLLRGAGTAAFKTGETAAANVAGRLASPAAREIVQKWGSSTAGSALEGAFYGLGEGVSEAALGDPDEIAQNLAAGTGMGFLFGGAFGSAFGTGKVAAPYFKTAIGKTTALADDLVQTALRKGAKASLVPALSLTGEREIAAIAGDLIDAPLARQIYDQGGAGALKTAAKEAKAMRESLRAESKAIKSKLGDYVRSEPKHIQRQIDADLSEMGGDINAALKNSYARYEANRALFDQSLRTEANRAPGEFIDTIYDRTQKLIGKLNATGDARAATKARELTNWLDAQMSSRGITGKPTPGALPVGDEFLLMRELRDRSRLGLSKARGETATLLKNYSDEFTEGLRAYPNLGDDFSRLEDHYSVFNNLRTFVTGVRKTADLNPKQSILRSVINDPEKARELDTLFNNIGELAPDIERIRLAGTNLTARQNAVRQLMDRLDDFRDRSLTRGVDIDDFDEIVRAIDPDSKMLGRIDRLKEIQSVFQQSTEMGPISKFLALSKALGKPIDKDMEKLLAYEHQFANLEKLASNESKRSGLADAVLKSVAGRIGLGTLVGGPGGGALGALTGAVSNPATALRTLTRLERLSRKTAMALERSTNNAVDALTKPGLRRAATALMGATGDRTLKDRRKDFKDRAAYLNSLRDPARLVQEVETKIGADSDAPMVSSALGAQFTKTAQFLAEKLPMDPLAHQGINYHKSPWEPSDFELARFERYVSAAENPTNVLNKVASGNVSPEEVETLKALYPSVFNRLQRQVLDAIMEPNADLTYDQRLTIGTLFDVPADVTLDPSFIASMQSQYAQSSNATPPPSKRTIQININPDAMQTEVSRLTYEK